MENFTPLASLIGGSLIGLSASVMLCFNGKIAGISGIVAGLLAGGFLLRFFSPWSFEIGSVRSGGALALAGLLVGFGTRLGNGCTSGHGVCGISRGSKRSLIATATFMAMGAAAVYIVNHLLGGAL